MDGSAGRGLPHRPAVRSLEAADGTPLLYHAWQVEEPRGCVRIVHGLGEHAARYGKLAAALVERRFSVYAADLRGHGVSGGIRGHVSRFDDYLSDLERLGEQIGCEGPHFLLGHSLGGLIALRAVQTGRATAPTGLILSAPALRLAGSPTPWRDRAAAVLSRVRPTLALSNGIDPDDLSRAPDEVAAYRADPLVHDRITPRLYRGMLNAMRSASAEASQVRVPSLVLLPGSDRVVSSSAARSVVERFRGEVRVVEYPDYFHEPLHERQPSRVIADILGWIEARIA